ncbi:hypothetical protein LOSG293_470010 [Secundilactobacillus oryzae JCM 18671]|uniref:Rad50/SbcC-type AAA domain-containing protein n=2 Tax=Secundilactobacillus oryzae TaxID=1202668 RepID=A0A081BKV4_9LACO|nr:hypothetical protein LOSG293_470010 [Secundilactobacillus oryzae JCM 18671]
MKLHNFKKFEDSQFQFRNGLNVLIGDNDAGKTTILKALDIVLRQSGVDDRMNKNEYGVFMNADAITRFIESEQDIKDLPDISIEIFLNLDDNELANNYFDGQNNSTEKEDKGIIFRYEFDEQFEEDYLQFKNQLNAQEKSFNFIPFDFYHASWKTFLGRSYSFRRNPLSSIYIDTDKSGGDAFSNYSRKLYYSLDTASQNNLSINLKDVIW